MPEVNMRLTEDDTQNGQQLHDNLGTVNKAHALSAAYVIARKVAEILDDKSDNAERDIVVGEDGQREKIIFPDFLIKDAAEFPKAATRATVPVRLVLTAEDAENAGWLYDRFNYSSKAHASGVALAVANYLVKQETDGKPLFVRTIYSDGRPETYEPFVTRDVAAAVLARRPAPESAPSTPMIPPAASGGTAPPPAPV